MKLAFFELEEWQKQEVREKLEGHEIQFFDEPLNRTNVDEITEAEGIGIFIYSKANKEILEKLPKLKFITTMSTGYDHIDLAYCESRKIIVSNVPTYGENTVAEHAFSLLLAISRKLYPSIKRTHEEHSFSTDLSLRGFDLKEKTIGIIGMGNIGQHLARMSKGFEMKVLAFDLRKREELERELGLKYVSLEELLEEADIISLHAPYNKATHHLIDSTAIHSMKKGVIIINTARGGLIDTHALVKGLKEGQIGGAALDVLEGEAEIKEEASVLTDEFKTGTNYGTLLEDHLLMKLDNVIVTPHNAFNSKEALERILHTTITNVHAYIGNRPENQVK